MRAVVVMLMAMSASFGAALLALQAGYSVWAALGIYALVVDAIAVACLIGGALAAQVAALRRVATTQPQPFLLSTPNLL